MAKRNLGTGKGQAPFVIGLGPGFTAGGDVDVVVETKRGHYLGRVIYQGKAESDTGIPGEIEGESIRRLLKSPTESHWCTRPALDSVITLACGPQSETKTGLSKSMYWKTLFAIPDSCCGFLAIGERHRSL